MTEPAERLRLSWSRDDEGVVTIYATDENTGKIAEAADLWLRPMCERLGWKRNYAKGVQEALARTLCENWNGDKWPDAEVREGLARFEAEQQRARADAAEAKAQELWNALQEVRPLVFGSNHAEERYPLAFTALKYAGPK